jgi:geranylgeranyl pyrophosphate synthase
MSAHRSYNELTSEGAWSGFPPLRLSITLPSEVAAGLDVVSERLSKLDFNGFFATKLSNSALHLIRAKGKLLRPALVLLGSHSTGGINELSVQAATAVEVIHTASLIHDDLIDRDAERRGVLTVHTVFGDQTALLAGDLLISKAIELSAGCGEEAIKELAKAAMEMAEGESRDYEVQETGARVTVDEYLEIVSLKTASLIGASAAIGGIVAGSGREMASQLKEYGRNLGIAFQIRDDYLNVLGVSADGKTTGNDLRNNRPNIVGALANEFGRERALILTKEMNQGYVTRAKKVVDQLPGSNSLLLGYAELMRIDESN